MCNLYLQAAHVGGKLSARSMSSDDFTADDFDIVDDEVYERLSNGKHHEGEHSVETDDPDTISKNSGNPDDEESGDGESGDGESGEEESGDEESGEESGGEESGEEESGEESGDKMPSDENSDEDSDEIVVHYPKHGESVGGDDDINDSDDNFDWINDFIYDSNERPSHSSETKIDSTNNEGIIHSKIDSFENSEELVEEEILEAMIYKGGTGFNSNTWGSIDNADGSDDDGDDDDGDDKTV